MKLVMIDFDGKGNVKKIKEDEIWDHIVKLVKHSQRIDFVPDINHMKEDEFDLLATFHEDIVNNDFLEGFEEDIKLLGEDFEMLDESDIYEMNDVGDGNLLALYEEIKMFQKGEIKMFTIPVLDFLLKKPNPAQEAINASSGIIANLNQIDKNMPVVDIGPNIKQPPKVGKFGVKKLNPEK